MIQVFKPKIGHLLATICVHEMQKRKFVGKGIWESFTTKMDIVIVISANGGMLVMYISFILYLNEK